jgi:hypothetical protein
VARTSLERNKTRVLEARDTQVENHDYAALKSIWSERYTHANSPGTGISLRAMRPKPNPHRPFDIHRSCSWSTSTRALHLGVSAR